MTKQAQVRAYLTGGNPALVRMSGLMKELRKTGIDAGRTTTIIVLRELEKEGRAVRWGKGRGTLWKIRRW